MYDLPDFKEKDQSVVLDFMRKNPFVFLCGANSAKMPAATQVPVFIDEREGNLFLTGHIMKKTDHHKAFVENENVLAICYLRVGWITLFLPRRGVRFKRYI